MSDMYDADELVDLIPRDVSASAGYKTADELARDLWRLANIVEHEFPEGSGEWKLAQTVFQNLKMMKWRP